HAAAGPPPRRRAVSALRREDRGRPLQGLRHVLLPGRADRRPGAQGPPALPPAEVSGPPAICQGVAALVCIAARAASGGGAPADIHLTASANRARVRIGKPVTIAYRVSNAGPGTATDVGLQIPLGE